MRSLFSKQTFKQYGWLLLLFSMMLGMLIVMGQILQNSSQFEEFYNSMLILSFFGIVLLLGLLVRTLLRLRKNHLAQQPGIKLTIRLSSIVIFMVGIPVAIVYYFAITFINQGIGQWFDVKTDQALISAVELVRSSQNEMIRKNLKQTEQFAKYFQTELSQAPITTINTIRLLSHASEATIFTKTGQIVAYSSELTANMLPDIPDNTLFQQLKQRRAYAAVETIPGSETSHQILRVLVPFQNTETQKESILQTITPVLDSLFLLSNEVKIASGQYQELSYLQSPLKTSFTLILSLVVLLTLVTAMLLAIQTIQNMARPIRTLTNGTQAVIKGDYSVQMVAETQDEFGELINSFNEMTQQIRKARTETQFEHQRTEIQKLYSQAIITHLNSGVMTLSPKMSLKSINHSANVILNTDLNNQLGKRWLTIAESSIAAHIKPIILEVDAAFKKSTNWKRELRFDCLLGSKTLILHGSALPSLDQKTSGYVVLIEDITQIVQAQLHAAWGDVAQRLAHEIKNPLTPIQLSAERLSYKLNSKLDEPDKILLTRMTNTIIDQVAAMKNLVQAFTEYADTPAIHRQPTNLNELVEDVSNMYLTPGKCKRIQLYLDKHQPLVQVDRLKIRQLLHNLIKNGIEACEGNHDAQITVSTHQLKSSFQIRVCDNGMGIPLEDQHQIFEPYASNKPKGTGLGLAIVKKIVDEHEAKIEIESETGRGTCFIMTLNA